MQMDLRTVTITPLRQTFGHLQRRLGADKPASRYLEATMDLQPVENFHFRPTWEPEFDIFDPGRTRITMSDWYALKDPRQYYYGTWTLASARLQEVAEGDFDLVDQLGLAAAYPAAARARALSVLLPLRHVAWAANINNSFVAAYGYGIAVTQAACYACMDQLGIAQYVTRLGMAFDDLDALAQAKQDWLSAPHWQDLRRLEEDLMVEKDWFLVLVAQNFCLEGLLFPLIYQRYTESLNAAHGPLFPMLTRFQREWYADAVKWVDAVLKVAAADNGGNKALLAEWISQWSGRAAAALAPVAEIAFGPAGTDILAQCVTALHARAAKAGLAL